MNKPPISRVVREVFQNHVNNMLRSTFAVDNYVALCTKDMDGYIEHMKKDMFIRMASHLEKHSDVTVTLRKEPALGIDEHVYRAETFVFTKQELIDLMQAVETATYDALHPMAKWGQGD